MRLKRQHTSQLRVFISYRRDDSSGQTGRLADGLIARLGRPAVYVDVDSLAPGLDFVDQIHSSLEEATVVLAVIGPTWLSARGPRGRRLDDENDYVRLEIEAALARDIPVVPVLVHGADMPSPADLPPSISRLSYRHAFTLSDNSWTRDLDAFVKQLQFYFSGNKHRPLAREAAAVASEEHPHVRARGSSRRWQAAAVGVAALLAGTAVYVSGVGRGSDTHGIKTAGLDTRPTPSSSPGVVTTALKLLPATLKFYVGQKVQLKPTVAVSGGPPPPASAAIWSTGNPRVVQVGKTGLLRAIGPGRTTVTVRLAQLQATAVVTVVAGAKPMPASSPTSQPVIATSAPSDQPPTLDAIGGQSNDEGSSPRLTLGGHDPDGDALTYSASGLPAGLHLSGSVISGTISPTAANVTSAYTSLKSAAFTVTVAVHAGGKSATRRFTWTVRDVEFVMPNYVGYYGCNGDANCTDPSSLRNVKYYNHHFTCTVTSDPNLVDTIASQSPTAGRTWNWTAQATFSYYSSSC